jgi:hypothetical protein
MQLFLFYSSNSKLVHFILITDLLCYCCCVVPILEVVVVIVERSFSTLLQEQSSAASTAVAAHVSSHLPVVAVFSYLPSRVCHHWLHQLINRMHSCISYSHFYINKHFLYNLMYLIVVRCYRRHSNLSLINIH